MTIPASISFTVTVVGLLFALLTFAFSRGPGWGELRYFALLSVFAALYTLTNAPVTMTWFTPLFNTWTSRIGILCGGLHGCAWYGYRASQEQRPLHSWERGVVIVAFAVALLAPIPGVVLGNDISVRTIAWLGVTYRDPIPTPFGSACFAIDVLSLLPLLVGYLAMWRRGRVGAAVHAIGLGTLILAAAWDSVTATFQLHVPYVLDVGFLALLVSIGSSIAARFVSNARDLERQTLRLKRRQAEMVKRERLAALGELSAIVAHEVRNPLGVIFNALATLKRVPPSSPDHAELLRIVQEEAERLKRVVADLLEFARPRELHLATVPVRELLSGATESARNAAGEPEATVNLEVSPELPPVTCDEQLVRQAVINLVANAIGAPERVGPVEVEAELDAEGDLVVRVTDHGAGIPPHVAPHIFTPFFTTRPTGTGLGLSVVQRIAEAHGGEVKYRPVPSPGHGAVFSLRIPRHVQQRPVTLSESGERELVKSGA